MAEIATDELTVTMEVLNNQWKHGNKWTVSMAKVCNLISHVILVNFLTFFLKSENKFLLLLQFGINQNFFVLVSFS